MAKRMLVPLLVVASLALPAGATANYNFLPPISPATAPPRTHYVTYVATASARPAAAVASTGGFNWGDAAIGAAVAFAACAFGAVLATRRRSGAVTRAG